MNTLPTGPVSDRISSPEQLHERAERVFHKQRETLVDGLRRYPGADPVLMVEVADGRGYRCSVIERHQAIAMFSATDIARQLRAPSVPGVAPCCLVGLYGNLPCVASTRCLRFWRYAPGAPS